MKVYLICKSAADFGYVLKIAKTYDKAVKLMYEERDKLVSDWKFLIDFIKKEEGEETHGTRMYEKMIENLSSDDFTCWNNYPHDTIKLEEWEVEE